MPQYQAFLKALGLQNEQNQLSTPPGAMVVASNIFIRRDNVVEPRRGFKLYGTSFGTSSDRAEQLMEYRNRIIRHYGSTLQYDTQVENALGQSIFSSFFGTYNEVQSGLRLKSIEANNNLYFTTSEGIKKISAVSGDDFVSTPGYITNAGGIKALDIATRLHVIYGETTGFLPVDSTVAYRVVWGQKDVNNNIILGTPSSPSVIYNSEQTMTVFDMMQTLYALDQLNIPGSRINDGNYVSTLGLTANASEGSILTNLTLLCQKLDLEQGDLFQTSDIISAEISNGSGVISLNNGTAVYGKVSIGDIIYLNGFNAASGDINGVQTVTDITNSEIQQVTSVTTTSGATLAAAGPASYFYINNANDVTQYYVWYAVGTATDPAIGGKVGIQVPGLATDSAQTIALNTLNALNAFTASFTATQLSNVITITNVDIGASTNATAQTSGFTISTPTSGGTLVSKLTFATTASGIITLASPNIQSGEFRGITVPNTPSVPATHQETAAIHQFLNNINLELQSTHNLRNVADNDGTPEQNPLEITTVAVTGTTTLTINFDVSVTNTDANNQFAPGDMIDLLGTWTTAGAQNISGVQTVATVDPSGAFITCTLGTPVTNGAVTVNTTSNIDQILRYTDAIQAEFINNLTITTTATVYVDIIVPPDATTKTFFQIYRGNIKTATGTDVLNDLVPDDEMKLVYEAFPTPTEIAARFITVEDVVPDSFIQGATNLYTNEISGEGILQANDRPPLAHDINVFKNYTWFANTSTLQRLDASLLGVTNIITDYNNSLKPQITISNGTTTNTYYFVLGVQEVTNITTNGGGTLAAAGPASYFLINGGNDTDKFYVWYAVGTATDPAIAGRTGLKVFANAGDSANQIAANTASAFNTLVSDFSATVSTNTVTVTNILEGPATDVTAGTSGFTVLVTTQGAGENAVAHQVLLSNSVSPAIAVTETAQSLVRVINENNSEIVNAFYLSGISDTPGSILFESEHLTTSPFYILANTDNVGNSFSIDFSPSVINLTNTIANPTVVSAINHGLANGDKVMISGSNSTPSIDGLWTVSNVVSNVSFTIPVNVTVAGTTGAMKKATSTQVSSNETKINRLYYSKLQQPEAVPILNYLDIGSQNKAILRIFPLRDSLFIFKEDGLYRVSGETPPWVVSLFDQTVKLIAPDSLGLANNLIYCWTKEGIVTVSEAGKQLISRPIDVLILPISSSGLYPNFSTATWGVGYESDNAYYVYTVQSVNDTVATICFRYSNLTNTWTTYDKTNTCGIVKYQDDKLYMGAGDVDFIEIERKSFNRTDYADREYLKALLVGNYFNSGAQIKLNNTDHVQVGDVIEQTQTVSVYAYNALLQKLDIDPQLVDADYYSTLKAVGGNNMRTKLEELAQKLDADTGLSNIQTFIPSDVNTGTDVITIPNHGFLNGQPVLFSTTGILPAPLNSTDFFYIIGITTNTFQVSTTSGGIAVNLTTQGTGVHTIQHSQYQAAIIARISYPIISNASTSPTIITSTNHGLLTGRLITIVGNTGSSPTINGTFVATRLSANTFSIPVNVLTPGTGGAFTTDIEDFRDLQACYNLIIAALNADPGAGFANYTPITDTTAYEAIITAFNKSTGLVSLNIPLDFIQGPLTLYKHFDSVFTYSSLTLGDPVGYKQARECEMFFENKTFTSATLSFATDLLPEFIDVPFNGLGNGLFGNDVFGTNFFGGNSHGAPFRTYVPRQCQRCRSLDIQFTHGIAREKYSVYGISITARVGMSSRAYR